MQQRSLLLFCASQHICIAKLILEQLLKLPSIVFYYEPHAAGKSYTFELKISVLQEDMCSCQTQNLSNTTQLHHSTLSQRLSFHAAILKYSFSFHYNGRGLHRT